MSKVTVMNGQWIEDVLYRLGWTQKDLAREAGVSERTVRNAIRSRPVWVSSMRKLTHVLTSRRPSTQVAQALTVDTRRRKQALTQKRKARVA